MAIGRPVPKIRLTSYEKEKLMMIAQRRKSQQQEAQRARIVLLSATGLANQEIAAMESVSLPTVGKWRTRFSKEGLAGLVDSPRSGAPRTIDDAKVEEVITRTLEMERHQQEVF